MTTVCSIAAKHGGYWDGEYPDYPIEDWKIEIINENTRLGYWQWVVSMIESETNPMKQIYNINVLVDAHNIHPYPKRYEIFGHVEFSSEEAIITIRDEPPFMVYVPKEETNDLLTGKICMTDLSSEHILRLRTEQPTALKACHILEMQDGIDNVRPAKVQVEWRETQ